MAETSFRALELVARTIHSHTSDGDTCECGATVTSPIRHWVDLAAKALADEGIPMQRSDLVAFVVSEPSHQEDMQQFQDDGEPWRDLFGIDGTAGDAQDIAHPFVPEAPGRGCIVCGMAKAYEKHTEDWTEPNG